MPRFLQRCLPILSVWSAGIVHHQRLLIASECVLSDFRHLADPPSPTISWIALALLKTYRATRTRRRGLWLRRSGSSPWTARAALRVTIRIPRARFLEPSLMQAGLGRRLDGANAGPPRLTPMRMTRNYGRAKVLHPVLLEYTAELGEPSPGEF